MAREIFVAERVGVDLTVAPVKFDMSLVIEFEGLKHQGNNSQYDFHKDVLQNTHLDKAQEQRIIHVYCE